VLDELDLAELRCHKAFRDVYITCEVCREKIRWTASWAWVRNTHGVSIRVCFDCLGRSVLLLPAPDVEWER
jgi:hypothetical protein